MIYEALFIIKPGLPKEEQNKVVEFIEGEIIKQGGEIKSKEEPKKKSLLYEIQKNKEGIYYLIYFEAPAKAMKPLNYAYKLNNAILRILIIKERKIKQ
ncbi:MAG: 30S ribosomal protein S6 [Candidatus Omnitrophica bacterium]|nr:30S ribosomal protein S6 [Candidatus Omnitrophota bacterium]